jgi:hypothetical protein
MIEKNNSFGKSRLEEQFHDRIDVINAAGLDSFCRFSQGVNSEGNLWVHTVDRFLGDAVCICYKEQGIYHFLLTNFRFSKEKDHLARIRSLNGRADMIVIVSFAYFVDLILFYDQIRFSRTVNKNFLKKGYEPELAYQYLLFDVTYDMLHAHDIIMHEQTGMNIFDSRRRFIDNIQDIFGLKPVMWYVPLFPEDLHEIEQNPYAFQLCVQREVDSIDKRQRPRIFVPGTGLEVYVS